MGVAAACRSSPAPDRPGRSPLQGNRSARHRPRRGAALRRSSLLGGHLSQAAPLSRLLDDNLEGGLTGAAPAEALEAYAEGKRALEGAHLALVRLAATGRLEFWSSACAEGARLKRAAELFQRALMAEERRQRPVSTWLLDRLATRRCYNASAQPLTAAPLAWASGAQSPPVIARLQCAGGSRR